VTTTVRILGRAEKALATVPSPTYERIRDAIRQLAHDARPRGCKKLAGRPAWRIRVGRLRVSCEIDGESKSVTILDIGHRRDVYR
jgi:mRNA interferase RelE/StbE